MRGLHSQLVGRLRRIRRCLALCAPLLAATLAAAPPATRPAAATVPSPGEVTRQLSSSDPAQIEEALKGIRSRILVGGKYDPAPAGLLAAAGKYEQLDALACEMIQAHPAVTELVGDMQRQRTHALLAMGKADAALIAAKSYYNVALTKDTEGAVRLVCVCLASARPADAAIIRQFKEQQAAGAEVARAVPGRDQPVERAAPGRDPSPASQPAGIDQSVLASIAIDTAPYDAILAKPTVPGYDSLTARGNLLLLAGKGAEARGCFEQAYELAEDKEIRPAIENIIRAIRAQYGCIGPANDYLAKLEAGGPVVAPETK